VPQHEDDGAGLGAGVQQALAVGTGFGVQHEAGGVVAGFDAQSFL
jgi:hypothetical protein